MPTEYDIAVIGGGPAGCAAATFAAAAGRGVALVERSPDLGGWYAEVGLPRRLLWEAAALLDAARRQGGRGVRASVKSKATLADLLYRNRAAQDHYRAAAARDLDRHHVHRLTGRATLASPNVVTIDGAAEIRARTILLATGSDPHRPADVDFGAPDVFDADSAITMAHLPRALTVTGGTADALEYATLFAALGADVTVTHASSITVDGIDPEIIAALVRRLSERGVHFTSDETSAVATPVIHTGPRLPRANALGLDALGITLSPRSTGGQTSHPSVFAAGDIIQPTPQDAAHAARVATARALSLPPPPPPVAAPVVLQTLPTTAGVGATRDTLEAAGRAFHVDRINTPAGDPLIVLSAPGGQLLGAHAIGDRAAEWVNAAALILLADGPAQTLIDLVRDSECAPFASLAPLR